MQNLLKQVFVCPSIYRFWLPIWYLQTLLFLSKVLCCTSKWNVYCTSKWNVYFVTPIVRLIVENLTNDIWNSFCLFSCKSVPHFGCQYVNSVTWTTRNFEVQ
jgi:hypothetical protein